MKIFGFLHNSIIGLLNESKTINLQIFYKQMTACPSFYLINWNQLDGLPFQSIPRTFSQIHDGFEMGTKRQFPMFPTHESVFCVKGRDYTDIVIKCALGTARVKHNFLQTGSVNGYNY